MTPYEASPSTSGTWRVDLSPLPDLRILEAKWVELQPRATCSFFQSWGWIGSWLATLERVDLPHVLEIRRNDRLMGLGLIGRRKMRRHRVIRSTALLVSETGNPTLDCLTVEHNGLLVDKTVSAEAVREGISWLTKFESGWDELFISAVRSEDLHAYAAGARHAKLRTLTRVRKPYYYVDCEQIRRTGQDFLGTLSRNTRYQVRRAMRAYEEQARLNVELAQSLDQAEEYFEQLRHWHQTHWQSQHEPGAFGTAFACDFHRRLVRDRFPKGEIQLLRVCAGTEPIGYLYNFVFDRVVYNYQSAFRYVSDARFKPGFVTHCCAIQHNIDAGIRIYDFLMGSQRFKQSLANHNDEMFWLVIQQPRMRFRFEQIAAEWRQKILSSSNNRAPITPNDHED
jgi:CelD/BcsL family acetyltransferase involved in cellulose biosynthesis